MLPGFQLLRHSAFSPLACIKKERLHGFHMSSLRNRSEEEFPSDFPRGSDSPNPSFLISLLSICPFPTPAARALQILRGGNGSSDNNTHGPSMKRPPSFLSTSNPGFSPLLTSSNSLFMYALLLPIQSTSFHSTAKKGCKGVKRRS